MSHAAMFDRKAPSLMWLGPIAIAIWCGLIVNGWAYRARNQGRVLESLNLVLEVMLAPGLLLVILWLALTPATWRRRAMAVGLLIVPSLPIALLACGQPGAASNPLSDFWVSSVTRVHFRELLSLSGLQVVLFTAFAVGGLRTMNHYLSRVVMHRWPLPARSRATGFRDGGASIDPHPEASGFSRCDRPLTTAHWVGFVSCGAALAGIDLWHDYVGGHERCRPSLVSAGIIVLLAFLIVWISCQLKWRWWSCLALGLGLGFFSGWPFLTRWAVALDAGVLPIEVVVQAAAIATSLFLLSGALGLLTLTHQMPRPLPRARSARPTIEVKESAGSRVMNSSSDKSRLPMGPLVGGIGFGLLWLLFSGLAYWVPRHLDLVMLVSGKEIRFDDAWLVAQLRVANGGEDHLAIPSSERLAGLYGDPAWHYSAGYVERRPLFTRQTGSPNDTYQVSVGRLGQPWSSSIEVIRQRALAGESLFLSIDEPTADLNSLRQLMAAGVNVGASLDLQGQRLPTDLVGVPSAYFRHFIHARVELADWEHWMAKGHPPWAFQRCQLPERLPRNLTTPCRLIDCEVSPALFTEIATQQPLGRPVELFEIRSTAPFAGDDQVRFLAAGGILAGRPPLPDLVEDDFPPIFQRSVWGNWSRWGVSVRELLRDPEVLQQVLEQRTALPGYVQFDVAGQITGLTLTPSLDCSLDRDWNTFPHVAELRLDLTPYKRDTRRWPSEEIPDDPYGFQAEAFPRLQRIVIGNVSGLELPPSMLTFLTDVLTQSNLQEVVLELPCAEPVWKLLAAQTQIQRLTIDVSPLRRTARSQAELLQGVSNLEAIPHLQEVVILDRDLDEMFDYDIGQAQGVEPDAEATAEVMAKLQAVNAKLRAEIEMEWIQQVNLIDPQLKVEVRFVPPPGGAADPNSRE